MNFMIRLTGRGTVLLCKYQALQTRSVGFVARWAVALVVGVAGALREIQLVIAMYVSTKTIEIATNVS